MSHTSYRLLSPAIAGLCEGRARSAGRDTRVTRTGRPLDRHHAAKIIARLGRRAGLPYLLAPHGLRHAFITLALDAGPACATSKTPPARRPRTTRRYDRARGNLDRSPSYDVACHLAN